MAVGADQHLCADDVIPGALHNHAYRIRLGVHISAALVGFVSNGAGSVYG